MNEVKKIATRQSYGEALKELGELHNDVVVLEPETLETVHQQVLKDLGPAISW